MFRWSFSASWRWRRLAVAQDLLVDNAWNFSEGLARVEVNKQVGYIDKTGKFIISPSFTRESIFYPPAYDFQDGRARFISGDKHGFIDKKGRARDPGQPRGRLGLFRGPGAL